MGLHDRLPSPGAVHAADGGDILGIKPATFRQRVARSRRTMRTVIAERCGLVDAANPCRCSRQIQSSLDAAILDPKGLQYANHPGVLGPIGVGTIDRAAAQLDLLEGIAEVFRSDPAFEGPERVWVDLQKAAPDLFA